jgi:hypothetical protein
MKRLKLSEPVGLDNIPGFLIKSCSGILIRILRHTSIFNLSLTQQYFPAAWKEAAIVAAFKGGNRAAVSTTEPFLYSIISLSCLN